MVTVICYFDSENEMVQQIEKDLTSIKTDFPHQLVRIDINSDEAIRKQYQGRTPILEIGPYHLHNPITIQQLKMTLGAALDRNQQLKQMDDKEYKKRVDKGKQISRSDRFSLWLANHYMWVFNILLAVFIGLPFLAPVLLENGWTFPAGIIYKIYSPLCHQLAYRSWFIDGEQSFYPRELAGINGVKTYEQVSGLPSEDVMGARNFNGNVTLGYKVALCERDVAIYLGILGFGLIFAIFKRKIRPIHWMLWILIGIIPMGIDGASQLPGLIARGISWLPMRESTPFLRSMTGVLFGATTAWYGYPLIEETMLDTRRILSKKNAVISQLLNTDDTKR